METAQTDRPSLEDRLKIDAAQTSAEIVTFLRREVDRLTRRGLVIGLSGGLDSTVCAYLCARAVGPERIWALVMPERDSAPDNVADAQLVARCASQWHISRVPLRMVLWFIFRRRIVRSLGILAGAHQLC